MLERVLLIDGNHLIYRAFFKFGRLSTFNGIPTGVIYGGTYILESIIRKFGPDKVIVVFDNRKSRYRLGVLPNYKNRESKLGVEKESFFKQRDVLKDILINLGIQVYSPEGYEADDVIAYLNQKYYRKGWETIIVSADKDFVQLINSNTQLFNVNKGILIDEFNCKDHYGYTPKQCVDYLSLCGDASDKIPGYPGVGDKRALKLLNKFGSIKKFLKSEEGFGNVDKKKLTEVYERNNKLINLMHYIRKVLKPEDMVPENPDNKVHYERVNEIFIEYEMGSFMKKQFFKTFTNLYENK